MYILIKKGHHEGDNSENKSDQKIYVSLACMSGSDRCLSGNVGDNLQLTNRILDSGATCHMTPEV